MAKKLVYILILTGIIGLCSCTNKTTESATDDTTDNIIVEEADKQSASSDVIQQSEISDADPVDNNNSKDKDTFVNPADDISNSNADESQGVDSKQSMEIVIGDDKFFVSDPNDIESVHSILSGLEYEMLDDSSLKDGIGVYFFDESGTQTESYYIKDNYMKLNGLPETYKITDEDFEYESFVDMVKTMAASQ